MDKEDEKWNKPWFKTGGPMNDHGGGFVAKTWQGWLSFIIFLGTLPISFYLADKFYPGSKAVLITVMATLILLMTVLITYKGSGRYYRKKKWCKIER